MIQISEIKETKEKSYTTKEYLLSAIIMVVIGSLIFAKPDSVIKFISYILAGISIVYGLARIVSYIKIDNSNNDIKYMLLASGIIFIVIGILLIIFSGAIEVIIRITLGIWLLFSGINQLVFTIPKIRNKSSYMIPLILSIILIICGLYMIVVANIIFKFIGLILLFYGILKIVMYVYFSQKSSTKGVSVKKGKTKTVSSKSVKNNKKNKN